MNSNIQIVLHSPSHPGNIGAAARAMRVMGISALRLVNPKAFPHAQAVAQASGALDVLENTQVFSELSAAIADCQVVFGTSARERDFPWPVLTPRKMAEKIQHEHSTHKVAIIFGTERYGLANEDLEHCHYIIQIPTRDDYRSLNLAQAVQIICYEIFQQSHTHIEKQKSVFAKIGEVQSFYQHLDTVLQQVQFLDPKAPRLLMRRLKRMFHRIQLETEEVQILRGILSSIQKQIVDSPK